MKEIFDNLRIINPKAKESKFYKGIDNVLNAWGTYYETYDRMVNDETVDDDEWSENNRFRILIDLSSRNVIGVCDYGRYSLDSDDILFQTRYLPLFTHQPEDEDVLVKRVNRIIELHHKELSKMYREARKPLYLLRYCGTNNYIAWSLTESKLMCVYGYKEYRDNFQISEIDTWDVESIQENTEYTIIPPSPELIKELELSLNPTIWSRKMSWDVWEPRETKSPKNNIPDCYKEVYEKAIEIINQGRCNNYGRDIEFARLENRVEQFEKLAELMAPTDFLTKSVEMMKDTFDNGYVLYEEDKHRTVFRLHDCIGYEYKHSETEIETFGEASFENENWYVLPLMVGMDRVEASRCAIFSNHGVLSTDVVGYDFLNNKNICVPDFIDKVL